MPDAKWFATASRGGYVIGEPNYSAPLPSRLHPGAVAALHRYPLTASIWLWLRDEGETRWRPERPATEAVIAAFRRAGKLL